MRRRAALRRIGSGLVLAGSSIAGSGLAAAGPDSTGKSRERILDMATNAMVEQEDNAAFEEVLQRHGIPFGKQSITRHVNEDEELESGSEVGPESHDPDNLEVWFYLAGPNMICSGTESHDPDQDYYEDQLDAIFAFEHDAGYSDWGEPPNDIFTTSFAAHDFYIPTDPREDTSDRVNRYKEDAYGIAFEYSDSTWGNDYQYGHIQVKPEGEVSDPDSRQIFGTYSHHYSDIEVESVTFTSGGGVSITVSDTSKQWTAYEDHNGDPLKSTLYQALHC